MDAETDPVPEESGSPAITPLSVFFPEVTDEEAKHLDGETARIMERRARVMALYRARQSMEQIRQAVGCSIGTVHHDIHTVLEGYKRIALRSTAEHLADALQQLAAREAQIEAEWLKSCNETVETLTGRRDGSRPSNEAKVRKKQRYGDPRLAAILVQIWERRCRLWGLFKAEDFRGKDAMPPVKFVAGIDPVEAV